ncbi:MAG: aminotransferase class V-fold PLP-dependent enzyme [Cyclobacteriaceae bacterium]|nr:aminotransferase class V-fold PLP-dependent enzyme [Cyclobacteriaceae bacterium]
MLHTLEHLAHEGAIELHLVNIDSAGQIDFDDLEKLLKTHEASFVSLMHGNNEIGNITDLARVGELCHEHHAYFHSDMVQTLGHVGVDLNSLKIQAISGSAHKFHGPKGVGLMYINADKPLPPLLIGGGQERNMRGGTENVAGIVGLAKALEIAYANHDVHQAGLISLKKHAMELLAKSIHGIRFNGLSGDMNRSLHKILSIALPSVEDNDMLLFNLDIAGICVSGGSACASGTSIGSHVIDALGLEENTGIIRLSFSKYNTEAEITAFVEILKKSLS